MKVGIDTIGNSVGGTLAMVAASSRSMLMSAPGDRRSVMIFWLATRQRRMCASEGWCDVDLGGAAVPERGSGGPLDTAMPPEWARGH